MNEKISIIVPVYNLEKYIKKCLISLMNQTYRNLEIIVVNDGSTDKTGEIISELSSTDERIICLNGGHKGVSHARNIALDCASGEYVSFVDGDDCITADCIQKLYDQITQKNVDIVVGGTADYDEDGQKLSESKAGVEIIQDRDQFISAIVLGNQYTCVSWGKLYKRSLIGDMRFDENISLSEDLDFLFRLYTRVEKVYYNSDIVYNWLYRNNSALHSAQCEKNYKSFEIYERLLKYFNKNKFVYRNIVQSYAGLLAMCLKMAKQESNNNIRLNCKKRISTLLPEIVLKTKMSMKEKIKLCLKLIVY